MFASYDELVAANINPSTFLATDYLNHFNEVIMLIDTLPSMPDMIGDVLAWRPKSYDRHFAESSFAGKALAITAYFNAPCKIRARFEAEVAGIDRILLDMIADLRAARADGARIARIAASALQELLPRIEATSAIINGVSVEDRSGHQDGANQQAVDALFAEA